MRIILDITCPVNEFNTAVKDGSAGQKIGRILDETKPEAVYFSEQNGKRRAIVVVDIAKASQIPAFAEPWFLTFNASVEFRVAMTPDDLQEAGLEELGKKYA
jgi:hypothetical protein